jgi:predicted flap endonuclease-1-like 5' DNA nuclease
MMLAVWTPHCLNHSIIRTFVTARCGRTCAASPYIWAFACQNFSIEVGLIQEDTWGINLKISLQKPNELVLYRIAVLVIVSDYINTRIPLIQNQRKESQMRAFKVFIFGLLYGWFLKIAFDRIYRGNEMDDIRNENASLREYIRTLEDRLTPMSLETTSVSPAATPPVETPAPAYTASEKDDLKRIKGIGPAIEKKLNQAGIQTYAALAALSTGELEGILGNTRRLVKEGELIAQAKKLARK